MPAFIRFSLSAFALLLLCGNVNATVDVTIGNQTNYIGSDLPVKYNATNANYGFLTNVNVLLRPSPSGDDVPLGVFNFSKTINTVSYNIPLSLAAGNYAVVLSSVNDTGISNVVPIVHTDAQLNADPTVQASFGPMTQPLSSDREVGESIIIVWTLARGGGKPCTIDLLSFTSPTITTVLQNIATVAPNSTTYTFVVPSDIRTGYYAVRIGYANSNNVNYSPAFKVNNAGLPSNSATAAAASSTTGPSTVSTLPKGSDAGLNSRGGTKSTTVLLATVFMFVAGNLLMN